MFTVYIMRSIFVIYIGVAGLKPKSVIYNHFLPSFSAALLFAAGALWLLLAFAIEHFEQDNSEKIECTVSAHCDSETTPSQKCVSIRSTKIPSYSSTRRFESVVPAPFLFLSVKKTSCGAVIAAKITPVTQVVANPANYVRAGPIGQYV